MSLTKASAIVLHSRKQGETSKILQLYSLEHGRISVMVKGSRGLKGKYWGTLEPLNHIAIVFYHKQNRDLHFVSQADLIDGFPGIHKQLGKLTLASIACEIVNRGEEKEHENRRLYYYLLQTLTALNIHESGLRNFLRAFILKYLELSGFTPNFAVCSICGKAPIKPSCRFSLDKGAVICATCEPEAFSQCIDIQVPVLHFLYRLSKNEIKSAGTRTVNREIGDEADRLLFLYLKYHIEHLDQMKSLDYLEKLKFLMSDSSD
jgi:DNA repair protein RecO (recombination protein O)